MAPDGSIDVQPMLAKTRLGPMKGLSILRLELNACVLAARVSSLLVRELKVPFKSITHWSDSSAALGYLRNTKTQFSVFVGHRVEEIQATTSIDSWRHVPTKSNPADCLTRGRFPSGLKDDQLLRGPSFLWGPPESWPSDQSVDPELAIDPAEEPDRFGDC